MINKQPRSNFQTNNGTGALNQTCHDHQETKETNGHQAITLHIPPQQKNKDSSASINAPPAYRVRPAQLSDVRHMMPLLNMYALQAEILPRLEDDVYRSIREWVVAEADNQIIGMGSLLILWYDLAEVRSLVISPAWHGKGIGRTIVEALQEEAEVIGLPTIFALTRQPGFFLRLGFDLTQKESLPKKVMKDCVFCPKFHACDETAVIKKLN